MEKITKASVISRAAAAGKARTAKRFDGLLKNTPLTMVCRRQTSLFHESKPSKQPHLGFIYQGFTRHRFAEEHVDPLRSQNQNRNAPGCRIGSERFSSTMAPHLAERHGTARGTLESWARLVATFAGGNAAKLSNLTSQLPCFPLLAWGPLVGLGDRQ